MIDYSSKAASSLRMLTKYGQDVTRRAFTTGAYDPSTGGASTTSADTTRKGAMFDIGNGTQTIRGSLVQVADKQLLLDAEGAADVSDHYVVNGNTYTVVSVGEVNPAGTVVLYDLHLRLS